MLRAASPEPSQTPISLVLVEPMLWTRFEPGADGLHARVHVSGAEPGDLVLVSGEAVIGEIVSGRLTIGEAAERGLIRLYGSEEQKAEFIGTYPQVGSELSADRKHRAQSSSSDEPQQAVTTAAVQRQAWKTNARCRTSVDAGSELACGPASLKISIQEEPMVRKLLQGTALASLMASASGCRHWHRTQAIWARKKPTRRTSGRRSIRPTRAAIFRTRPFFGDTHLHTSFSMDAGAFGARLGPRDAYRFAKGEEVTSSTGQPAKLSRPLDFLVVADHSDNMGFFPDLLAASPTCSPTRPVANGMT